MRQSLTRKRLVKMLDEQQVGDDEVIEFLVSDIYGNTEAAGIHVTRRRGAVVTPQIRLSIGDNRLVNRSKKLYR